MYSRPNIIATFLFLYIPVFQITDDIELARVAVDHFRESCEFLALQNASLYTEDDAGQLQPPRQILGKMCPSECNGRGACVNGICECDSGIRVSDTRHFGNGLLI